ncbi:5-deoxy-glucuronate isomerase [Sphingomonas sp. XXL09]|uniref:5-deoxy-glucuronate isomerase n=1 Tax=Sphingomonas sp. XXL09 TaxID=3457787 RepID=UPI00406B9E05
MRRRSTRRSAPRRDTGGHSQRCKVLHAGQQQQWRERHEPASAAGHPLLERRELGVVNIGAPGRVTVDGEVIALDRYEALYVPMGSADVRFAGDGTRFYLLSVPAHAALPLRKVTLTDAEPMRRGSLETSNDREIHQLILPHRCASASLVIARAAGLRPRRPG